MNAYVKNEKLFNQQADEFLQSHPILKGDWLDGFNGNVYTHLDNMLFEKFEIKFGFIDSNETQPVLYFKDGISKKLDESTIPRIAYKNLVEGVIKTAIEQFRNIEE